MTGQTQQPQAARNPNEPAVFDNVTTMVKDDLAATLAKGSRVAVAADSFSLFAFDKLKKQLAGLDEFRFLFTSPTFLTSDDAKKAQREFYIPRLNRERALYGSEFEIALRNELNQKAIAKECAEWIRKKARFRSLNEGQRMNPQLTIEHGEQVLLYTNINEFTTNALGFERDGNAFTRIMRQAMPHSQVFLDLFAMAWKNDAVSADVTEKLLAAIKAVFQDNAPETIYFMAVYNIFKTFLTDIEADAFADDRSGFENSVVWNALYDFQKEAVRAIISKLDKFNGCILADSVGLGKTFTALAVIKYYEIRNKNVLVLCPKKLADNWNTYRNPYDDNILLNDRLRYTVLYHTDLLREHGTTGDIDLARLNWSAYDLVVIDESHNFRNGGQTATDGRENRYQRLLTRVISQGVPTKVLMLSATPVNNRFLDLRNQLALAYEGKSEQWKTKLQLKKSIEDIFRQAQTAFGEWSKREPTERTTAALLQALDPEFFHILDSVTIARSRKHIERFYDSAAVGRFPTRLRPISEAPKLSANDNAPTYRQIAEALTRLNLEIYRPTEFILPSRVAKYAVHDRKNEHGGGLTQKGREQGIRRLMAVNLLKRLESSVSSFRQTVTKVREYIAQTLENIEQAAQLGAAKLELKELGLSGDFDGEDENTGLLVGSKVQIALEDMDYVRWRGYLESDQEVLDELLCAVAGVGAQEDEKLRALFACIDKKQADPINPGNKKLLIFTAFSDTAEYLYEHVSRYAREKYGLHTGMVTGRSSGCKTTIPKFRPDFNRVLTWFSPRSKNRRSDQPQADTEIDILIGTDCISEGQNLQDCDYVVNYDIHWNPVRIIQRFGRVDRIGSKNTRIQLVNFWPHVKLDEYINLRERVEARMKAVNVIGSGDGDPTSEREQGDLEYRRQQLERLHNETVDIEEMSGGLSIMDLGLNEYRQDLLGYVKKYGEPDTAPHGLCAVVAATETCPPGVIFVLRNRNEEMNKGGHNLLHPYYMAYIRDDGEIELDHLSQKKLLDTLRQLCKGRAEPIEALADAFNHETKDGRDMTRYSALLGRVIRAMAERQEGSDIDSLFHPGGTTALETHIGGLDDFELICFLVVRPHDEGAP